MEFQLIPFLSIVYNILSQAICSRAVNQTTYIRSLADRIQTTNQIAIAFVEPGWREPGSQIRARLG